LQLCRYYQFTKLHALPWLLILLVTCSAASAAELSDEQKKQQIHILYNEYQHKFPDIEEISPEKVIELMADRANLVLIDTRDDDEMAVSMLPDAITAEDFLQHIDLYKNRFLIAYCTIGYRSGLLADGMIDKGIVIHNLKGGILGWIHAGGAVLHDGKVINRVHVYGRKWDLAPAQYETVKYSIFKQLF